jgi:NAD(P)-dependent dehydrogenase (short-subunit alcohol dehydrogenase family)
MVFDRFTLKGKVAIVTGAGRGLGPTMALALAQAGAAVVAVARTEHEIQKTADAVSKLGKTGLAVAVDVADSKAVDRLVAHVAKELGSVDILINNAGGENGHSKPMTELGDEEWRQILSTNLTGAFYCARAAGRYMLNRGWGRVINVTCIYGARGSVNHAAYAAAKGGLIQFSQALALEWAEGGVTVNTLGLGWFEDHPQPQSAPPPEALEQLKRAIPVQRLGLPMDVESVLVYLASDASRYFTGQSIWLDGGILCR